MLNNKVIKSVAILSGALLVGTFSYLHLLTPSEKEMTQVIALRLNPTSLPYGALGLTYKANLNDSLQVFGDPGYPGHGARWAMVAGELPSGLRLEPNGFLVGEPERLDAKARQITVEARYRGVSVRQVYQLAVRGQPAKLDYLAQGGTGSAELTPDGFSLSLLKTGDNVYPSAQSLTCQGSGKWYWEVTVSGGETSYSGVGITGLDSRALKVHGSVAHYYDGKIESGFGHGTLETVSTKGEAGTYGVALNADEKKVQFFWRGVPLAEPMSYANFPDKLVCPSVMAQLNGGAEGSRMTVQFNGGSKPFAYPVPEGYSAGLYLDN